MLRRFMFYLATGLPVATTATMTTTTVTPTTVRTATATTAIATATTAARATATTSYHDVRAAAATSVTSRSSTGISATGCVATSSRIATTATHVASSTTTAEAMISPAMAIAPISPWAYTKEDAVIEVTRPVIAIGCAGIRCIVVVSVGTDWRAIYANNDLGVSCR